MNNKLFLLPIILGSHLAMAECDFGTGIEKSGSGYIYTTECHKKVGKIVVDLEDREKQVEHLNKALELKTEALIIADDRNLKLRKSLYEVEDRVAQIERFKRNNEIFYFIGGVVFTGLAVWGAGHLK